MKKYFLNRYEEMTGDLKKEITAFSLRPSLRINTLKINPKDLLVRLNKKGVKLEKIPFLDHGYWYSSKFSLGATIEYLLGYYYLQEAASQLPAIVLEKIFGSLKHKLVLDAAAAPGSKTTHLAMLMQNTGRIIALDSSHKRLRALANNLERCDVTNTVAILKQAEYAADLGMKFDAIILDAPCSGNFTQKNWFSRRKQYDPVNRSRIQKKLLSSLIDVLKPSGVIIYSTCSLEVEENELVVQSVLDRARLIPIDCIGDCGLTKFKRCSFDESMKHTRRLWPHKHNTQGFFVAALRVF